MSTEHLIQIICANPELTREYVNEFQNAASPFTCGQLRGLRKFGSVRKEAPFFFWMNPG